MLRGTPPRQNFVAFTLTKPASNFAFDFLSIFFFLFSVNFVSHFARERRKLWLSRLNLDLQRKETRENNFGFLYKANG